MAVNTDEFVEAYKGHPPVFTYSERRDLIQAMGYEVVANPSAGRETIAMVEPDVIAIGSDWARRDYYAQIDVTQDFLDSRGISMVYVPYTPNISTSDIVARVRRSQMFRLDDSDSLDRGAPISVVRSMSDG